MIIELSIINDLLDSHIKDRCTLMVSSSIISTLHQRHSFSSISFVSLLSCLLSLGCIEDQIEPDTERDERADMGGEASSDQGLNVEDTLDAQRPEVDARSAPDIDAPSCAERDEMIDCDDPACSAHPLCMEGELCQDSSVIDIELNEFVMRNHSSEESRAVGSCVGEGRERPSIASHLTSLSRSVSRRLGPRVIQRSTFERAVMMRGARSLVTMTSMT